MSKSICRKLKLITMTSLELSRGLYFCSLVFHSYLTKYQSRLQFEPLLQYKTPLIIRAYFLSVYFNAIYLKRNFLRQSNLLQKTKQTMTMVEKLSDIKSMEYLAKESLKSNIKLPILVSWNILLLFLVYLI